MCFGTDAAAVGFTSTFPATFPSKDPSRYHLLLAPPLLPTVLRPVQSLILFIKGPKLYAFYKHTLGISCPSVAIKRPSGSGYRTKQGCKKKQNLLFHSSHHNSTETVLKKCLSHLLIKKPSLYNFLQVFSSLPTCLEKSFQQTARSIALVQFRRNAPCSAPRGHEKWHSSSLLSFPPLPPSNMRAVAKKVIMMEKLLLFWEPLPSLLKMPQVQHLRPDSAKEAYLSSPQHGG